MKRRILTAVLAVASLGWGAGWGFETRVVPVHNQWYDTGYNECRHFMEHYREYPNLESIKEWDARHPVPDQQFEDFAKGFNDCSHDFDPNPHCCDAVE